MNQMFHMKNLHRRLSNATETFEDIIENEVTDFSKADCLQEISDVIKECLDMASFLVRDTPAEDRSKAYWLAHMRCALNKDHGYLGGSMFTMEDSIEELEDFEAIEVKESL